MRKNLLWYSTFHSILCWVFSYIFQVLSFFIFQVRSTLLYFWPIKSYFLCWTHLVIHQSLRFVKQWVHSPCRQYIYRLYKRLILLGFLKPYLHSFQNQTLNERPKSRYLNFVVVVLRLHWITHIMWLVVFCSWKK